MFNKNLKRNHAKLEQLNTAIKHTSMPPAARRQFIGGGDPTIKKLPCYIMNLFD